MSYYLGYSDVPLEHSGFITSEDVTRLLNGYDPNYILDEIDEKEIEKNKKKLKLNQRQQRIPGLHEFLITESQFTTV